MVTSKEWAGVREILRLHDEAFKDYLERHNDGHKSSEGVVELGFGNFWERDGWDSPGNPGKLTVGVYSYALGPSRMHYFDSVEGALDEVKRWHREQLERPENSGEWYF